ncbi:hypothetical protein DFP73DRAFT_478694 [Morchella snyderi]|nr:hypothetical protein DFP73DRAFT_478694 [Morchella snyderi]
MVEADRSSLNLALKRTTESTETADFFEEFEELTTTSSNGEISQNELDVPYRKERDTLQFRKWIKSFRRKETNHRKFVYPSVEGAPALIDGDAVSSMPSSKADTKTPSSSMRFVTAVKTASNTFASLSIAGGSTRRKSSGGTLDDATVTRMRDRRCALEELINTEEYYIADLKVLMNLYFSVLNDCDCISADVKDAIKRNVAEILDLHESLLSEIFRMLPAASHQIQNYKGKFLDISPQVGELERTHILSNPEAAAKVAEVFDKMMRGFFVYEEYSAKYELVCQDLSQFRGQSWNSWEKGCEMLAGAINSLDNQREYGKRALTLDDMLVKPIQRICKYPLFFAEIVKYTPAMDCPQTNRLLEKVRYRLEETAYQINTAKREAPRTRERIEKTWLLQDRIDFQEKSGFSIRLLGHIVLCGVLHVVWQRQTGVTGEYLACLLYKSYLLLATVSKADNRYSVKFAITLATARIEEVNQGRGLTCHSALFSWKIIFEAGHRIYEILVSACSAKEEEVWRTQILDRATAESRDYQEYSSTNFDLFGSMNSDVKPIGTVFGRPGTLVRHQSLHRSGSDPKSDVANVIIKNTHALSEVICSQSNAPSINRSLSVLSINRVPIFSPKRSDRNSIEAKLADVWTKDMLSFGSMGPGTRKRADTSNLMKRLSVVSLVSTVARKSMHSLQSYGSQSEASSIQSCESGDGDDFNAIGKRMTGSSVKSKQPPKNVPNIVPMKRAFSFSATGRKNSNDWKHTWRKSAASSKDDKRRLPMTQEDVSVTYETAPQILTPMANNPTTDSEFGLSRECLKDISSTALNDVAIPTSPPLNSLKIQRKKRSNALGPKPNLKGTFRKRFFSRSTAR